MKKLNISRKLASERGAIEKVIVTFVFIIFAMASMVAVKQFYVNEVENAELMAKTAVFEAMEAAAAGD